MYQINPTHPVPIHFIGIGGISMSGLAEVLLKEGFPVSGSDRENSPLLELLAEKGARVAFPQRAENIPEDTAVVVYTAAIREDNPELMAAKERGLPLLTRAELLGQIMSHYPESVAVAGTHGKTTTTGMLSEVLLAAGTDPTVTIGGMLPSIGGNIRVGGSPVFVAEACEYTNSFLSFYPKYEIITSVETDHMDFFHDLAEIRTSFRRFAGNILPEGVLIINAKIENWQEIAQGAGESVRTVPYGPAENGALVTAGEVRFREDGCADFEAFWKDESLGTFSLSVPGTHNVENALAVIAAAREMGISLDKLREGISSFRGADRRFQVKGTWNGVRIVDDYAHHPTEIAATLAAAGRIPHGRLVVAFQPHTYSRTKAFLTDFADALSAADLVVLTDIYAAREKNTYGISSADLERELAARGTECHYLPSFDEAEKFFQKKCLHNDLLITMGAGDIWKVGENLLRQG